MSITTIITRTLAVFCLIAIVANILLINSSATLGGQIASLENDLSVLARINGELTTELSSLYDIKRIAVQAQELGFKSSSSTIAVTLPDPLAMQP